MVTTEAAIGVVSLLLVTLMLLALLHVASLRIWAQDAARESARMLARGEPVGRARDLLSRERAGAVLTVGREDGMVRVTVRVPAPGAAELVLPFGPPEVLGQATMLDEGEVRQGGLR